MSNLIDPTGWTVHTDDSTWFTLCNPEGLRMEIVARSGAVVDRWTSPEAALAAVLRATHNDIAPHGWHDELEEAMIQDRDSRLTARVNEYAANRAARAARDWRTAMVHDELVAAEQDPDRTSGR